MELNWTPELEVALFHSLHGHKPVGGLYIFSELGMPIIHNFLIVDMIP